jgi:CheY-like chemotaxis protein
MSHEIRTPLNAIIGTIMLLQYHPLSPEQKEQLRVMEISSENLLNLVNDVLDFSKMEEGKINFVERTITLLHFLKNIKMVNRVRAEEKGDTIKILYDDDVPKYVTGDDVRLGQILNNLVSNAVKLTQNGPVTIRVGLHFTTEQDVLIDFSIEDTGIPPEKQGLIFERFTQANNNITRDFGGSGLGLTIIKRLLELQNSHIQLESEVGKGSRFYFTLRFKKHTEETSEESKPEEKLQKQDLSGLHILLVEDVAFKVMVAEKMLQHWHATVDLAANGAIAVEKIRNNTYDLVLMDIQMPVMDGYTATREVRKFNQEVPIIALTTSAINLDIQSKAFQSGMNGCITKPFNPGDLSSIILEKTKRKD